MYPMLQNVLAVAFVIAWLGGTAVLFFRYRAKQRAYLQHFPPVEGIPLDMYWGGGPRSVTRALFQALRQRQTDSDVERLRREVWWRYRSMSIWSLGFPIICSGVAALLIVTGLVH